MMFVPARFTVLLFGLSLFAAGQALAASQKGADMPGRPVAADAKSATFTVAVLGDGFAEALLSGLKSTYAGQADVLVLDKTHAPFGLSQTERFEWPIAIRNLFAGQAHVDAAVIMLGANDTMAVRDGGETLAPTDPRWKQLYGRKIEEIVGLFHDKGIPLTWVGLPIVQNAGLSADFVSLNELIREHAVKAGATYVDSWAAFVDDGGQYSATGPDLNGQKARLRTDDGVDFTKAGERKLASFVETDLRRDRDQAAAHAATADTTALAIPEEPSAQIDVNAQIRREAGLPSLSGSGRPEAQPARIGPIVSLTAPVSSPNGQLAALAGGTNGTSGEVQRTLVEGHAIQPKSGRLDDFSWPRR